MNEMIDKMIEWFKLEIEENLSWDGSIPYDISDEQIGQLARDRVNNLIGYIHNQCEYIPGDLGDADEEEG